MDVKVAAEKLQNCVNKWETSNANDINMTFGDFNNSYCEFERYVETYDQCAKIPTCDNITFDKLFCNVKDSYRAFQKSSLRE